MNWEKVTLNAHSPYLEDRRVKYISGDYEITKEGDVCYWLRFQRIPLGKGPRLRGAKEAALAHKLQLAR